MTKKQQEIYNWLIQRPGYFKKSINNIALHYMQYSSENKILILDVEIALKQAKTDYKATLVTNLSKDTPKPEKRLKRLYFDLETSPNVVFSWNVGYKLNISYENIIQERAIICACYKWEGESEVKHLVWNKGDDSELIYQLYDVLMEADEIVGHNGDNYDIKWFRTRCLYHGILNMPDIKSIDTLKLSRKSFRFNSNRLDYIGQFLKLGKKMDTGGFSLWTDIIVNNNEESLNKMVDYCKQDVILLEKVYNKLSGYSTPKTHVGVLLGKSKCSCPKCGSEHTHSKGNIVSALGTIKKKMVCVNCNTYFRVSKTAYDKRD